MAADYARNPTAIAAYTRAIATALEQRGIDPPTLFETAGVALESSPDPLHRIGNPDIRKLFEKSVAATGDPYFGIAVAECFHAADLHALGFALLSSSSLRDFCMRLHNYYRLVSQNAIITLEEAGEEAVLLTETVDPNVCDESQDVFATLIVRFMREVRGRQFNPLRVDMIRAVPPSGDKPYRDFFNCEVRFGQTQIRIVFYARELDRPLPGASKELAQLADTTVMQYLAKLDKQDIVNRVRTIIVEHLSSATMSKQLVADKLHMSPRNLQLKLADQGTSFQNTLDKTRQSLATGYIEQSSISITEIAYLLGFTDVSNFTRAFKRWTGKSPSEYRRKLNPE